MEFLFEKREYDILDKISEAEKMLHPFKLPLDYKLFISFFELTPILLKFDKEEGEFLNNPEGKEIILSIEERNIIHEYPQQTL